MFKNKVIRFLIIGLVIVFSGYLVPLQHEISWWVVLMMIVTFGLAIKNKKYLFWICLLSLVITNLVINDLLFFRLQDGSVTFDSEQSFWKYPGIEESIQRYGEEGLIIPFRVRDIFYSSYLKFFVWLVNFSKLLSPDFWIKTIGFAGSWLLILGVIDYLKDKQKNINFLIWFLLILATSAIRMMGSSQKFIFLALPVIFYWIFRGLNTHKGSKDYLLTVGLLLLDFLL